MKRALDFIINKEWAVFVGLLTGILTFVSDQLSVVDVNDSTALAVATLGIIQGIVTRINVFSNTTAGSPKL